MKFYNIICKPLNNYDKNFKPRLDYMIKATERQRHHIQRLPVIIFDSIGRTVQIHSKLVVSLRLEPFACLCHMRS